jgi:hypothetical protein
MCYNDRSVLENHHVSSAMALLQLPGCNFFEGPLTPERSAEIRSWRATVVDLVLSTDLAEHLRYINDLKTRLDVEGTPASFRAASTQSHTDLVSFSTQPDAYRAAEAAAKHLMDREDQLRLWRVAIKCADLGHSAKPWPQHQHWSLLIAEEMYRQGDLEAHTGLPISALMDRSKVQGLAGSQIGFLDFICTPLFELWELATGDASMISQLRRNRAGWELKQAQHWVPDAGEMDRLAGEFATAPDKEEAGMTPASSSSTMSSGGVGTSGSGAGSGGSGTRSVLPSETNVITALGHRTASAGKLIKSKSSWIGGTPTYAGRRGSVPTSLATISMRTGSIRELHPRADASSMPGLPGTPAA